MVDLEKHAPAGSDLIAAEVTSAIALYVPGAVVERLIRTDARTWKIEAEMDGHAIEITVHDHGMPGWPARHLGTTANTEYRNKRREQSAGSRARQIARRVARGADGDR